MAKDYAKRVLTTYKKPKKKKFRLELLLIPIVCLGVISYWVVTHRSSMDSNTSWYASFMPHAKKESKSNLAAHKKTEPELPAIHFDFYQELPSQHVPLPVETTADSTHSTRPAPKLSSSLKSAGNLKPNTVQGESQLVLVFGQFVRVSEASQLRLSLLLSDCEADVVEIATAQGPIFRVQKGPFMKLTEAKKLQAQLEKRGVLSELKKG